MTSSSINPATVRVAAKHFHIDIAGVPPTKAELQRYSTRFHLGIIAKILPVPLAGAVALAIWPSTEALWAGGLVMLVITALHLLFMSDLEASGPAAAVEDQDVAQLLAWCGATPEARAYRDAVLQQGRTFVRGEYHALGQWTADIGARESLARLYNKEHVFESHAPESEQPQPK